LKPLLPCLRPVRAGCFFDGGLLRGIVLLNGSRGGSLERLDRGLDAVVVAKWCMLGADADVLELPFFSKDSGSTRFIIFARFGM
jgi:hypothetical protein